MDKDNAFACARMHAMHSAHAASSGSSYQLILEHILSYPGSYEIPLRTMYTLNSAPRAQPLPPALTRSGTPSPTSSAASSPTTPQHAWQESHAAATHFTSSLMAQISQLPTQPCSLPPSFVTAFNRRCFLSDIRAVDFPQALTALDYLKDLETRRRKEVVAALQRLSIDRKTLETDADRIARTHPGSVAWLKALGEKERKVEALYTQLYVGLRRFVLINELSLEPFNRYNCFAMLNTLYPPVTPTQTTPTPQLTTAILQAQRDGFIKYIKNVELKGPSVLHNLIKQGAREGEETGWPGVHQQLDMYLRLANHIIEDCQQVTNIDYFESIDEADTRKGRKVDSGVSFGSEKPPSTGSGKRPSTGSEKRPSTSSSEKRLTNKPLPSSPSDMRAINALSKSGSALERIAREFRKLRSKSKVEAEEIVKCEHTEPKAKSLRKTRSLGALRLRNLSSISVSDRHNETPAFNPDEMRRHRLVYEANASRDLLHDHKT